MRWIVDFVASARREFLDLPHQVQARISRKIVLLETNPVPPGAKKLRHPEARYRLRVGDYRVLYRVLPSARAVEIFRVSHRKDAYRNP
jgi:mRNA interferase RelE/StbE